MIDRRCFLKSSSLALSGAFLAFSGFQSRINAILSRENPEKLCFYGLGELIPTPAKNTGEIFLALPEGFQYNVFGRVKSRMSDGNLTPPSHDGMATFSVKDELRLIRNHEVTGGRIPGSAIGQNPYDESAPGGTTTLIVNPRTRELIKDFVSLSGTLINCAGGPTPWGSWISCEETTLGKTVITTKQGKKQGGFLKPHGYCFEVFASANAPVTPIPIKAMGRFVHEAIAVDAKSGIVYLTEDNNPAGFYRFLPKKYGKLLEGGTLQILKVKDSDNYDTRKGQKTGKTLAVSWINIDNPDPEEADIDEHAVFNQGAKKGAAIFTRLEGIYAEKNGKIYFVSTSGGNNGGGQIWLYTPINKDEGTLTLLFESPDRKILDMPDNICLHPTKNLLFICEDSDYIGGGGIIDNFIRILTPDGKIADFAKNITPNFLNSEFAGSTFSKDGETLFVNLQSVGVTLAIWGDWQSLFKRIANGD
jgi:secreted PhoX family phosphatase